MNRIIAVLLALTVIVSGCGTTSGEKISNKTDDKAVGDVAEVVEDSVNDNNLSNNEKTIETIKKENIVDKSVIITNGLVEDTVSNTIDDEIENEEPPEFSRLDDKALLQYVEDNIYSDLEYKLSDDDYIIENVNAVYISKEYLEERAYNSQTNVFFGYSLADLNKQFMGTKYVFTLGDDGTTVVQKLEEFQDDTYEKVIKNVAIGTGVILVCVTVSVVTAGAGTPTISLIFAASAKTGTTFALSSGAISAAAAAVSTGVRTGDVEEAMRAAAVAGSEGFKWGAISGAVVGGAKEGYAIHTATKTTRVVAETIEFAVDKVDDVNNVTYISTNTSSTIPTFEEAEKIAAQYYKGNQQVSYLAGQEVSQYTPGATRPDIVRMVGDHIEAIEVKRYDFSNPNSLPKLYSELQRQLSARAANLPPNATQRICLNIQGRGFSEELVSKVVLRLRAMFPTVPIDIIL
ncbi:MAG: hypothetical protein K6G34_15115 [Lachnospiraceae bacterium]|nr:hypothetical protein [Lachnospiraceae bacterium]